MTRQKKNKIRGLLLLLVFSLNTLAGFACSVGLDMGYNASHHQHEESHTVQKTNAHSDGHQHHHAPTPEPKKTEHHNEGSEDDCCTNGVADFIKLDKSVASFTVIQPPIHLLAFVSHFILPTQEPSLINASSSDYVRRSWRPHDHTDLRIVIQSFQI
jgi:hypothetical protein